MTEKEDNSYLPVVHEQDTTKMLMQTDLVSHPNNDTENTPKTLGDLVDALPSFVNMDISNYHEALSISLTTEDELQRSICSFVIMIIDLYLGSNYCGTIIKNIRIDLDKLVLQTEAGEIGMKLPHGRSSLILTTRGVADNRLWSTTFIITADNPDNTLIYGARLNTIVAGRKNDGTWKMLGRFEDLLAETPKQRVIRMITDEWRRLDTEDPTLRLGVAAQIILSETLINFAHTLNPAVGGAIDDLEKAAQSKQVSRMDNPGGYRALAEFQTAKAILANYLENSQQDPLRAITLIINQAATGVMPYQIKEDPMLALKKSEELETVVTLSMTRDKYIGIDNTSSTAIPQITDKS